MILFSLGESAEDDRGASKCGSLTSTRLAVPDETLPIWELNLPDVAKRILAGTVIGMLEEWCATWKRLY